MNERILIVEDNKKNMYLMKFILLSAGFLVLEAEDGQKGVEIAMAEVPDLILMDMQLPLMDGYEASALIKADEKTRNIPVIALTAYAMKGDREKTLAAGCDEYLEKPIDPENFVSVIQDFLRNYSASER